MSNNGLEATESPRRVRVGVRRINNLPVWIVCGILFVFLAAVCIVGALRGSQQSAPQPVDHGGSAAQLGVVMVGNRDGGIIAKVSTPSPTPSAQMASAPQPAPSVVVTPTPNEVEKARLAAYQAALRSKPGVENGGFDKLVQQKEELDAQKVAALQKSDPNNAAEALAEYRRELDEARNSVGQQNAHTGPNDLSNFSGSGFGDRWALTNRVKNPPSPYIIQTGSIIPAVSVTAMDSDLPGAIVAQVSQNVYDSPTGNYLLIPQGAKLYGEYVSGSGVGYGQSRLFVAWERIIFPNGSTLDIQAMPGSDAQGMAGLRDQADSHWLRTFGSALLMSAITAGVAISQPRDNGYGNHQSASSALSEALGQNLGTAMSQLLEKNLNVAPTLKIRAGFRFNVMAIKDLIFQSPYVVPNY